MRIKEKKELWSLGFSNLDDWQLEFCMVISAGIFQFLFEFGSIKTLQH